MTQPLLVQLVSEGTTLAAFLLEMLPTFLGALLGFLFAWLLAQLEAGRSRGKEREAERQKNIECLREALLVSSANIEALLSSKKTLVQPLVADTLALRTAMEQGNPVAAQASLEHYFRAIPSPPILPLPDRSRWAFAMVDLPYLTLNMLRFEGARAELADLLGTRNALIGQYASEEPAVGSARWRYFVDMMNSATDGAAALLNDALYFSDWYHRQISDFFRARFAGEKVPSYKLGDAGRALMPKPEDYSAIEKQLVKFPTSPKKRQLWPRKTA